MLRLLDSPNNLLGIEYCKALSLLNSQITPVTIKREGAGYHEKEISWSMPSATALRRALVGTERAEASISGLLFHAQPDSVAAFTEELLSSQCPVTEDDFSLLLKYRLLLLTVKELAAFADVSLDLARRIRRELNHFASFSQFISLLKTRGNDLYQDQQGSSPHPPFHHPGRYGRSSRLCTASGLPKGKLPSSAQASGQQPDPYSYQSRRLPETNPERPVERL